MQLAAVESFYLCAGMPGAFVAFFIMGIMVDLK